MDVKEATDQGAPAAASKPAKARRRSSTKGAKGEKRSLNLRIDADSYERLAVHALRRNTTISALVEGFAQETLREFYIVRGRAGGAGAGGDDEA